MVMMNTDNGSGGAIRRFAGSGADAYRDYRSWKKWARAYLIVQRAKGTPATALGPMLFTLLDDVAARASMSLGNRPCAINISTPHGMVQPEIMVSRPFKFVHGKK